jgi:restriction endonuclease S subunit
MKWEKRRIRDFAIVYDGPHSTPKEVSNGPIFLGIKNIRPSGGLDLSQIRHISDGEYAIWTKRVTPQHHDIVLSYEATLHRYAIIPNDFIGCLGRRMALVRVNENEVSNKFLYYTFLSEAWRRFIDANKLTGATVDRISITDFPDYEVQIPPLPTQRRIASILSAYDDLIENNLRRVKLLEEKAQIHYKELMLEISYSKIKREEPIKDCLAFYIGGGWGEEEYKEGFTEPAFVIRGTDIPDVRSGNVSGVPLRFHKFSNLASRKMQDGDIVFEISNGQINNIGRTVLISQKLLGQFDNSIICASFAKTNSLE